MRKIVYELVEFSDDEHDLALGEITRFLEELDVSDGDRMTFPVIALSSTDIAWGQHGIDAAGKFALVLDVHDLTMGVMESVSPLELGFALLNADVRHKVTHAMINAMAWIKDVETRGLNVYNEREVRGFFHTIQDTFVRNVAKLLARKLGM